MAGKLYIPEEVIEAISKHVKRAVSRAKRGYWSAFAEEDTLTGALLSKLQATGRKVAVADAPERPGGIWSWEIDYHKFRSKPQGAPEGVLGADAIFTIKLRRGQDVREKSLLMQAKIEGTADPALLSQCSKLSTWREAAFVLNFSPEAFEAVTLDDVFRGARSKDRGLPGKPLDDFISADFLPCKVGDVELRFDARRQVLQWRNMQDELVSTRFRIGKRVALRIKAPDHRDIKEIQNSDVHNNRMSASPQEILSLFGEYSQAEAKKARAALAKAYHTDLQMSLGDLELSLLNRRMQEINNAYDQVKSSRSDTRRWRT